MSFIIIKKTYKLLVIQNFLNILKFFAQFNIKLRKFVY